MNNLISVREAARRLGLPHYLLSDIICRGRVDTNGLPLIAGRRLIPVELLPRLREQLLQRGYRPEEAANA